MGKLFKLKWYCNYCRRQCNDENGYKVHCSTFSHQAAVQRYNLDPSGNKAAASNDFLNGFCAVLQGFSARMKLKKGPIGSLNDDDWVDSNLVYQEYIKDRHHVHLSATRWNSVAGFIRFLGQKGIAEVKRKKAHSSDDSDVKYIFGSDEGIEESGGEEEDSESEETVHEKDPTKRPKWFIKLIDKSPEAILEAKSKSAALKKVNEEQLLRARQLAAVEKKAKEIPTTSNKPKISHVILKPNSQAQPMKKAAAIFDESSSSDSEQNSSNLDYLKPKKLSVLDELAAEVISKRRDEPPFISYYPEKSIEINLDGEDEAEIPWIRKGLVIRIGNESLADGTYFGLLALIDEVIDDFGAQVSVLKNGDVILLDQEDCQPVSRVKDEDFDEQLSAVGTKLMSTALKTDRCVLLNKGHEGKEGRVLRFVNSQNIFEVELLAAGSSKIHRKVFELEEGQFCIYWD